MTDRLRKAPRHPIAKRFPQDPPPRIEINVHRHPGNNKEYFNYSDEHVCSCFPTPSDVTIPSMYYDRIKCPHHHQSHIQPAQEHQFNYPWTADSVGRHRARGITPDDESQVDRLSLISEEDEELRFTPAFLRQRLNPDILSMTSAPPFRYRREMSPRIKPPFTAPKENTNVDANKKRSTSLTDLRDRRHRYDTDRDRYRQRDFNETRQNESRQFTGNYVDPKDGKVYQYNVNYGKQSVDAVRRPIQGRRATTADVGY